MSINHYERAFKIWNVLTKAASDGITITYKEISEITNIHWRAQHIPLGLIQDFCAENNYPPLTILAVNNSSKQPGSGFHACSIEKMNSERNKVINFDWKQHDNPFEFAENSNNINKIIESIRNFDFNNTNVTKIKSRGILQAFLKDAAMNIYNNQCAMCNITIEELLEACHIKPYTDCNDDEKKDLRNIIILCKNHHKLFDSGLITLDEKFKMHISHEAKIKSDSDKLLFNHIDNVRILLPKDIKYYPDKKYIQYVNENK